MKKMKKLLITVFTTTVMMLLLTSTTFAMVSNPSSFRIREGADKAGFSTNKWIPKSSLATTKFTGTSMYFKVSYDGYGSNYVNVNNHVSNFTETNVKKVYRFGDWVGYESIIRVDNIMPGTTNIQIGRIPNQGMTAPKDSVYITLE